MAEWDMLIRQARHANLLGRLARMVQIEGLMAQVPEAPKRHLLSAFHLADRQHLAVQREADELRRALTPVGVPLILLKGAAYVLSQSPASLGRVFADIDILVPKDKLGAAESTLMLHGWQRGELSAYDERYYRQWMHELPPMQHLFRGSALDVHHTILPPTARYHPDPRSLVAQSVPVDGWPGVRVLAPTDMVLHSACHLFHEGEADNALRDLSDLDLMLRHYTQQDDGFWMRLIERAGTQQLVYPLWLTVRYLRRVWQTPVPANVQRQLDAHASGPIRRDMLDAMYDRIFRPQHATCNARLTSLARFGLYVRGHWLRMPPHLLLAHLARKAATSEDKPTTDEAEKNKGR